MRVFMAAVSGLLLASCQSAINPYIPYPNEGQTRAALLDSNYPLDKVLLDVQQTRVKLTDYADQQGRMRTASNLGVFGGAAFALVGAMYGAPRDALVGGGAFSGGSYAAGQLFTPAGYAALYRSALPTLACIENVAGPVRDVFVVYRTPYKDLDKAREELAAAIKEADPIVKAQQGKSGDPELDELRSALADAYNVQTAAQTALIRLKGIATQEGIFADRVNTALTKVIDDVNRRLQDVQPTAADARQLAGGIGSFGLAGLAEAGTEFGSLASGLRRIKEASSAKDSASQYASIIGRLSATSKATQAIIDALPKTEPPGLDAARKSVVECKLADATAATLTRSPATDITLKPGETAVFSISGGQAPYTATVLGVRPSGLEIDPISWSGQFTVKAASNASDAQAVPLEIRDGTPNSPAKLSFNLSVKK